ncbi:MAG: NAD(P)H-hydrate dehydratase [Zetaproteobacteria bacterium]|nr:NAD(P)H-hydrate dehydratase [Zetaproteobacteria bacterium]
MPISNSSRQTVCDIQPIESTHTITVADIQAALPKMRADIHKYQRGHVWIFGGSTGFAGAPQLSALGAMAAGAGLVSIVCTEDVYPIIATHQLATMVHPQTTFNWQQIKSKSSTLVAGPGWGHAHADTLSQLIAFPTPLIVDADALNTLAQKESLVQQLTMRTHLTILTPHHGEAARLLHCSSHEIIANRSQSIRKLANKFQCWVVLKGANTLIASPSNSLWHCPFGNPNLARAGTGDVLAGVIAAMVKAGEHAASVAITLPAAVALHALAGESDQWFHAGELAALIHQQRNALLATTHHDDNVRQ